MGEGLSKDLSYLKAVEKYNGGCQGMMQGDGELFSGQFQFCKMKFWRLVVQGEYT